MRAIKYAAVLAMTACLFSCVWSLQPLFEESDLVFEPALVGTWQKANDKDTWTFEKAKTSNAYVLVYHEAEFKPDGPVSGNTSVPGDTVRFEAKLGRLAGHLFLDLIPEAEGNPQVHNDLFNWHLIRAHTICRVWLEKDELRLDGLEENWLEKALQSGQVTVAHVQTEDGLVVTAPTKELQQLVAKYAEDKDAFPPAEDMLHRVKTR
jgi:hypothetical protein